MKINKKKTKVMKCIKMNNQRTMNIRLQGIKLKVDEYSWETFYLVRMTKKRRKIRATRNTGNVCAFWKEEQQSREYAQ